MELFSDSSFASSKRKLVLEQKLSGTHTALAIGRRTQGIGTPKFSHGIKVVKFTLSILVPTFSFRLRIIKSSIRTKYK